MGALDSAHFHHEENNYLLNRYSSGTLQISIMNSKLYQSQNN
jgi:hypothetical protein